jgi:hypothetical protein
MGPGAADPSLARPLLDAVSGIGPRWRMLEGHWCISIERYTINKLVAYVIAMRTVSVRISVGFEQTARRSG